jgi:3-hydroxyisobutyrate dehydrogenase
MRIAFIGLGNMGSGMSANLARAGHDVSAFDINEDALARAVQSGCRRASSTADAVADAEIVITMLPTGKHVAKVYADDVFGIAPVSALLIDCSTIDVATARAVEAQAAAQGIMMIDAPVSGGISGAGNATLTFMVGGEDDAFTRAQPILAKMGKTVVHAGGSGAGQTAKICNNMLLGATMVATCEAFAMARKLGLDLQTFYDISSVSSGQSWSMTTHCPVPGLGPNSPANNAYQGGFATALMLKDLKLAMEAAQSVNAAVPMGAAAESLFQIFANSGGAGLDFSAIIRMLDAKDA